jgi:hypothetical protein
MIPTASVSGAWFDLRGRPAATLALAVFGLVGVGSAARARAEPTDLDTFMQQVLTRRDDNWTKLQQYILDEREEIELRGPSHSPVWGERRDYAWYIRDGFFVRSPVKVNGVSIGEAERRQYEDDYLQRQRAQERHVGDSAPPSDPDVPADLDSLIQETRRPEFISSAYFLRFPFDEGRYALVGHDTLNGHDLLRIEYYPSMLFSDAHAQSSTQEQKRATTPGDDERMLALMDKASLVTLWVDQTSCQIVKYTFDNITPNFIEANSIVQVAGAHASMTMGQPFPEVWLPDTLEITMKLTFANGDLEMRYARAYHDYRRANVTSTLHVPELR